MVITMELKYVIRRGKKLYFRMLVPKDCVKAIGKTEIVIALKTEDPSSAKASAARLEAFWISQFKQARGIKSPSHAPAKHSIVSPAEDVADFRQGLIDQMEKNLPDIFDKETEEHLRIRFK